MWTRLTRHGCLLVLSIAAVAAATRTISAAPPAKPDFTIWAEINTLDYSDSFVVRGTIRDDGWPSYVETYIGADGQEWESLRFWTFSGGFTIGLPVSPEEGVEYFVELTDGYGDYDGLYAAGTATVRVRWTWFYFIDAISGELRRWRWPIFHWKMSFFLP